MTWRRKGKARKKKNEAGTDLVFGAGDVAVALVGQVAAVVDAVAERGGRGAVVVVALELARLAEALLARAVRLVRAVLAVLLAVALPIQRDTPVVLSDTTTNPM